MHYQLAKADRQTLIKTLQGFEVERTRLLTRDQAQLATLDLSNPSRFDQARALMRAIEKCQCANSMVYLAKSSTDDINAEYSDTELIESVRQNAVDMLMYLVSATPDSANHDALTWAYNTLRDALYEAASLRINPSVSDKEDEIAHCAERAKTEADAEKAQIPTRDDHTWTTDTPLAHNGDVMTDYLDNEMSIHWNVDYLDGTYAEITDDNGQSWGLYASGNGDDLNHKIEFVAK